MCNCQRDPSKDPATENEKVNNLREEIIKRLEQTVESDRFLREEPMKKHITFRVGGPAACFLTPSTKEQIRENLTYLSGREDALLYPWKRQQSAGERSGI